MSEFDTHPFPARVKVMTWNVWGNNRWPERESALVRTVHTSLPDVLLLQEVCPAIIKSLDELHSYSRVDEPSKKGWNHESQIYYNKTLLTMIDHGCSNLDIPDHPNRGLFWARFQLAQNPAITFFTSTVHMPWQGCPEEIETGMNQRIPTTIKVVEQLRRICPQGEPAIVAGDFNDDFHPIRVLQEEMGFTDVFELLDLAPPITHPVRCSSIAEVQRPDRTIDWITCSLPVNCNVAGAYAKNMRGVDCASDHYPVIAFFEFRN
jgi:endonuclease/exonuclease/phosphatase family metal-dependent hydrolase